MLKSLLSAFLNLFKHKILLYTGYEDIKQVERRSDGDGNENGKKAIGSDWQNNNFAPASRFFVHFLAVVARLRRETS